MNAIWNLLLFVSISKYMCVHIYLEVDAWLVSYTDVI